MQICGKAAQNAPLRYTRNAKIKEKRIFKVQKQIGMRS